MNDRTIMYAIFVGESINASTIDEKKLRRILELYKKARQYIKVDLFYIVLNGERFVGIVKNDVAVTVNARDDPIGIALLEAEKILFNFINNPKREVIE